MLLNRVYDGFGGLEGSIASRAELVCESMRDGELQGLRRLFLDLSAPGAGTSDVRRRVVKETIDRGLAVPLGRLLAERLVVVDRDPESGVEIVEVAHEALLVRWPRLRQWLDEDRSFRLWRQRISLMASPPTQKGREEELPLLRGLDLEVAQNWATNRPGEIGAAVARLIDASSRAARAARVRRTAVVVGFGLALGVTALATSWGWRQSSITQANTRSALASSFKESGRVALLDNRPLQAATLLSEAYRLGRQDSATLQLLSQAMAFVDANLATLETGDRRIQAAAFSPDDRHVVSFGMTASRGYDAQVWDLARGVRTAAVDGFATPRMIAPDGTLLTSDQYRAMVRWRVDGQVAERVDGWGAVFDSRGDRVAIFSGQPGDIHVTVHDFPAGTEVSEVKIEGKSLTSVTFSPDSRLLATGGEDVPTEVWDVATGRRVAALGDPDSGGRFAVFSPDSLGVLTSGGMDHSAVLWNVASQGMVRTFGPHDDAVLEASFSPDGSRLVTVGLDALAKVWSVVDGASLFTVGDKPQDGERVGVGVAQFSPDGSLLATVLDATQRVELWDAYSGARISEFVGHTGQVTSAQFDTTGSRLVTGSNDGTVRVWDVASFAREHRLDVGSGGCRSAQFDTAGTLVLTLSDTGTARVWNVESGRLLSERDEGPQPVRAAAFAGDSDRIVTTTDAVAAVWSPEFRLERQISERPAALDETGALVVQSTSGAMRRIGAEGEDGPSLPDGVPSLTMARLSPGGYMLALESGGEVRTWDLRRGEATATFGGGKQWFTPIAFDGAGAALLVVVHDGSTGSSMVEIVDARAGGVVARLPGCGSARFGAFSPDGRFLVTACGDGEAIQPMGVGSPAKVVSLWDVAGGRRVALMEGHSGEVWGAAFSSDGGRIATVGWDGTVRIWDAETGRLLRTLDGASGLIHSVAFDKGGDRLVTCGYDGAHIFDVPTERRSVDEVTKEVFARGSYRIEGGNVVPVER